MDPDPTTTTSQPGPGQAEAKAAAALEPPAGWDNDDQIERLLRIAAGALGAPVALLSQTDEGRPRVVSMVDTSDGRLPLDDLPTLIAAARSSNAEPSAPVACLGAPLRAGDGGNAGSLVVVDARPRDWTGAERALLRDLAALLERELQGSSAPAAGHQAQLERRELEAVLDAIGEAVIVTDPAGLITYWNRAATHLYGWQPEEVLGRSVVEVTPSEASRAQALEIMEHLARGERWTGEFTVRRRDGEEFPALVTDAPIWSETGFAGMIGVSVDLSRQKYVEARLRDEAQLIETLYETGRLLVGELDLRRLVQAVTDAATSLTGAAFGAFFYNLVDDAGESYTLFTLSGAPLEAFSRFPMPRNTAIFGPTFRGERVIRIDDVLSDPRYGKNPPYYGMPQGHLPVRSYLAVPVVSRGGEVFGGLFFGHPEVGEFGERAERLATGIAAQAAIAIENARLFQTVSEAVRTRENFLAIAAHELKTPLTSVKGFADLLHRHLREPELDRDRLERYTDQLRGRIGRLEALVHDLLDVSRVQQGALELHYEAGDLTQLAAGVLERFRESPLLQPEHRLMLDGVESMPGSWDLGRLDQVLTNLVTNAIKYSPLGGEVRLTVYDRGEEAVLEVRDQGIGIGAEVLPHIFEPFIRSGVAQETAGSGLGLYIARQIVQRHGGHLAVTSQPGVGSVFTATLPRQPR